MSRRVLVIGGDKNSLLLQKFKEEFGEDVVLVTTSEAKLLGLGPEDFANTTYEIKSQPIFEEPLIFMDNKKQGKCGRARNKSNFKKQRR